jgi:hypothetical protein
MTNMKAKLETATEQPELTTKDTKSGIPDPFAPENLRLSQDFAATVGVKKILATVPVRKPGRQDFVRVRPGPEWRGNFPVIDLKDDGEEYIVTNPLVAELSTEIVSKTLFLAITRQGTLFFWPVRLPSPDGKDLSWWRSARLAAEQAQSRWTRVVPNKHLGAYEIFEGDKNLSEPEWPADHDFYSLIRIAFRDALITDLDHPVVKRLRGRV